MVGWLERRADPRTGEGCTGKASLCVAEALEDS